jgi:anthranilate/para-aminobenzoate synthase component I
MTVDSSVTSLGPKTGSPAELLVRLPPDSQPHLLDARADGGWGERLGASGGERSFLGVRPEVVFRGGREALEEARRWLAQFRGQPALDAVLVGSFAYELGHAFAGGVVGRVDRRAEAEPAPVCLAGFRALYVHDAASPEGVVVGGCVRARAALAELLCSLPAASDSEREPDVVRPRARTRDVDYLRAVRRVQDYIRSGDVYQVNLARRLDAPCPDPMALRRLYLRLADATAAPFCAYLEAPEQTLLSSSPERFLRSDGAAVETRPIKGTRPRGRTPSEDAALLRELLASAKDRAEHVMIVDLERNDLGRVCEIGSVRVSDLCRSRSFSDVHHLVSTIRGRLRDPGDWVGLLEATFPGGSITGAPKLRAMQIIAELEPVPRGVYTGAVGSIDAAGRVDLSIAIRTAIAARGLLQLHLGGGIVSDSDPESELRETRDKGRGFARSWGFET